MKAILQVKPLFTFAFFLLVSFVSLSQAKLTVSGAKVNMTNAVYVNANDVSVADTGFVDATASTLKVAGSITSSQRIDVRNGTLEMNGTAAQEIPANSLTDNIIKNLTTSGSSTATVGGPLALTDVLTLTSGNLASNGMLTLKSISSKTARVAPVTTNAIMPVSGNVIAERYISSKRAFRFLTSPVNTPDNIRANWMENTNNPSLAINNNPFPGFGTHITGAGGNADGFDVTYSNNPSLFTFNNETGNWVTSTNTNALLKVGSAYRILVRGNRSTDISQADPPSSVTTLRSTGTLATGTIVMAKNGAGGTPGMPVLSAVNGGYSFIGNPYASPVDWDLIEKTNISGTITIWDPTIDGLKSRGAYVSYNSLTGVSNIASQVDNNIQSGQAFFVQSTGSDPSLTFREVHKSVVHRVVFRVPDKTPHLSLQLLLPGQETTNAAADGLAAYFGDEYSSSLAGEDSYKLTNLDENIAIARNGSLLSIEGRKPITVNDTLPLKTWQLLAKNYLFKSVLTNFEANVEAYFNDSYSHTSTKLNNGQITFVPFKINTDSLSFAANRFKIVFKTSAPLAVILSSVIAYTKSTGIQVDWVAESESNTEKYDVEKSSDAQQFSLAASVGVKANTGIGSQNAYSWFDEDPFTGYNYYRIKSIEKSGEIKYSKVVKVNIAAIEGTITVATGPEKSNSFNLIFKNIKKGKYELDLFNSAGQKVYNGSIYHNGGSATFDIKSRVNLPSEIYHLQIAGNEELKSLSVLIE